MFVALRILDSITDQDVNTLPIAFSGSLKECNQYAQQRGFIFKRDSSLFSGYYADKETGTCLIPTVHPDPFRVTLHVKCGEITGEVIGETDTHYTVFTRTNVTRVPKHACEIVP